MVRGPVTIRHDTRNRDHGAGGSPGTGHRAPGTGAGAGAGAGVLDVVAVRFGGQSAGATAPDTL